VASSFSDTIATRQSSSSNPERATLDSWWSRSPLVTTITSEYASETVRRFFDANGPYGPIMKSANVPPSFVIIQRINLGLYAIFGQLHATGNWRRISEELWPFVGGPPSTELGRQAAGWTAAHPG